jgi:hypothetical protein
MSPLIVCHNTHILLREARIGPGIFLRGWKKSTYATQPVQHEMKKRDSPLNEKAEDTPEAKLVSSIVSIKIVTPRRMNHRKLAISAGTYQENVKCGYNMISLPVSRTGSRESLFHDWPASIDFIDTRHSTATGRVMKIGSE